MAQIVGRLHLPDNRWPGSFEARTEPAALRPD